MDSTRRRHGLFAAAAALLFGGLALVLVEAALRMADFPPAAFSPWIRDDQLGFRLAPGIRMRMTEPEYDVEVATNSLGLRDDEPADEPAGGRILLLGDSFAMGYGVERGQLFADLLEKALDVDVVNAGTGGYEMVQQPRVLARLGPVVRPGLVVYALYLGNDLAQNDEWEEGADGTLRNRTREYPVRRPSEWKIGRLVRNALYGVRKSRGEKDGEWLPFAGYLALAARDLDDDARADYALAAALAARLKKEADAQGLPLVVVLLPYRQMVDDGARRALAGRVPDLEARYDLGRPAREAVAALAAAGIAVVDASPALVGEGLFFPVDGHLTAAGHARVAAFLQPLLGERLAAVPHL